MSHGTTPIEVYVESGQTRTFAAALHWPGWSRSGRGEEAALRALYDYGQRYARVLESTSMGFLSPSAVSELVVVERLPGNATTDFGAPDASLSGDTVPVTSEELARWQVILRACWQAFDQALQAADGKSLRKGPRGGGRDLSKIIQHVREVNAAYVSSLGAKLKAVPEDSPQQAFERMRDAILAALTASANGEIPAVGPRGGLRWTPRYFVRRLAWHELDHAWEIEDRIEA
ncbi:MAG: DinB family protein [Anaerolineae bacterium]